MQHCSDVTLKSQRERESCVENKTNSPLKFMLLILFCIQCQQLILYLTSAAAVGDKCVR